MSKKIEVATIPYAAHLNADVDMSISQQSLALNLRDAVLEGAVTADNFKAYLTDYASAMSAQGRNEDSVKVMKSQRKMVFDFAFGLRKEQKAAPEMWTLDITKRILDEKAQAAGSLSQLVKLLKEAMSDEKEEGDDDKPFDFEAELVKLIAKAQKKDIKPNAIKSALNKQAKSI